MLDSLRAFLSGSHVARWGLFAIAALVVLGLIGFGGWTWYGSQQAQGAAALAASVEVAQKALAPGATPEIFTHTMAAPWMIESSTRRSELPTVRA